MRKISIPPVTAVFSVLCIVASVLTYINSQILYDNAFVPFLMHDEPWRFVTSIFFHMGILHVAFNVLALIFLGIELEPRIRSVTFALLLIVSALGGNAAIYGWAWWTAQWGVATVGASGAIFGLFGALLVLSAQSSKFDMRGVLILVAINVVMTFTSPEISWQAHLGGLFAGGIFMAIWGVFERRRRHRNDTARGGW